MGAPGRMRVAGALAFAGGAQFIPALAVAESLYPGYSVSNQPISDLGATCSSVSGARACTIPPSATLFDASVFLLGLLALAGACFILRSGERALGLTVMLGGIGAMGVGVFPETTGALHVVVSFITFFFAGVSAILSSRSTKPPMACFSVALGVASLLALSLYAGGAYLGIGQGGMERLIAYPALIWLVGFGAHLMARQGPS